MAVLDALPLILGIAITVSAWLLARALGRMWRRAKTGGLAINGAQYRSVGHLLADVSFLNALWDGTAIENSPSDPELQRHLQRARTRLRVGIWIQAGLFAAVIFGAFLAPL